MSKTSTIIIFISLAIIILAALYASPLPDGLEKVAETLGFIEKAEETPGVMPDYSFARTGTNVWPTIIAGIIGVLLVLTFFFFAAYMLYSRH